MVIFKIDSIRGFTGPAERDAIVTCNTHAPFPGVALKAVEPVACYVHLIRLRRYVQRLQDTRAFLDIFSADPACFAR